MYVVFLKVQVYSTLVTPVHSFFKLFFILYKKLKAQKLLHFVVFFFFELLQSVSTNRLHVLLYFIHNPPL